MGLREFWVRLFVIVDFVKLSGGHCAEVWFHLDWVPIGPRFSNGVLQALIVLLNKRPPKVRVSIRLKP